MSYEQKMALWNDLWVKYDRSHSHAERIRNCSKTARGPLAENFPPQQALQIYLPAQPVFEQTSF